MKVIEEASCEFSEIQADFAHFSVRLPLRAKALSALGPASAL